MDEVKALEVNLSTNGEGSANLVTNGEVEPQKQVVGMETNNAPNDRDPFGGLILEPNASEEPVIEQEDSTDPKPLDSPIDDRLTPTPEPSTNTGENSPIGGSNLIQEEVLTSIPSEISEPEPNDVVSSNSPVNVHIHANDTPITAKSHSSLTNGEIYNHEESSPRPEKDGSVKPLEKFNSNKVHIDTTAPFESVRAAVSMFGAIVDWKAHKVQTVERRKYIEQELEKVHEEIPFFKKKAEAAEEAKQHLLKELDDTKRLIEELKLNLERAQTEERQAKQDAELAKLRVEEMEQGIADESSVAAKAQLEVAHARHEAAVAELETVKGELENLSRDYELLVSERDIAIKNAKEAVSKSKDIERAVEDLTIELITVKESLESAHAAHLEAEEHRIGVAMAREQDALNWEKELSQAEEELEKVKQQIISTEDLKSKLDTASVLLQGLKAELAAYMGEKVTQDSKYNVSQKSNNSNHKDIQAAIAVAKMNLEEVNNNIEKAIEEINCLKLAATSLSSELEREKTTLGNIRQREGMASVTVASLESELNNTLLEIALVRKKEKEAREKMVELPKQLQKAAEEADYAKSLAKEAHEELNKAKDGADQAKAGASTMTSRLFATQKEIEAAKASENLALAAISAFYESESARSNKSEPENGVTLSLEEYYELSKKAQEAEDEAKIRVSEAISQIDVAKESELKALSKLEQMNSDLAARKETLSIAMQKAEKAKEGKLAIEQELRTWRAEHEQRRKGKDDGLHKGAVHSMAPRGTSGDAKESKSYDAQPPSHSCFNHKTDAKNLSLESNNNATGSSNEVKPRKKKKRSFFPRIFMFFSRKKGHSNKNT